MRNGTDGLNANASGVARRTVTVELLTGENIFIPFGSKTTCNAIWNRVEGELVGRGVVHPQIFGLAIKSGSDWVFVDPDAKLSKYYPHICKEGKSHGQSQGGAASVNDGKKPEFYCRIHFYLDSLPQNFDVVSLHHYYLQLRQNLLSAPRFPPASIIQPLAYALQFEIGDWRPGQEVPRWVSSHQVLNPMTPSLSRAHQTLAGLGKEAAKVAFIRAVMPQYNMHLFAMTLKTKEEKYAPAWIGVTPKGIEVYQNAVGCNEIPAQPRLTFLWANITKLYFERKKYGIRGRAFPWANSTQKLSFTAATESVPQHLLHLCRSTHQFHLSNHKILMTAESVNGNKGSLGSTGGESSCNSTLLSSSSKNDDKMLDLSLWADGLLLTGESSEHQRVSVISNASSNTTSGIVSDRVYSLDGSEAEDLELRELPDCTRTHNNHDRNSTSLESLSQRHHPPRPRKSVLARAHTHHQSSSNSCNGTDVSNSKGSVSVNGDEGDAKFWYCGSDCEDCDDSGPCRSMLVRTVGKKQIRSKKCAGHCECNSCITDEEEHQGEDVCDAGHHHHHNTPSMASDATLKAVDFDGVVDGKVKIPNGESVEKSGNKSLGGEITGGTGSEVVQINKGEGVKEEDDGEIEEYKLEDEHVYGEIIEDPEPSNESGNGGRNVGDSKMKTEEQQYSTIEEEEGSEQPFANEENKVVPPKPKPRYSCIKSVEPQKSSCKCRVKDKCCTHKKVMGCKREKGPSSVCAKECKKCMTSSASSVVSGAKDNGLTPKVASLKCLRKAKPSCSSNIRRHISNRHRGEINFAELPPVNYVEFGEKLQQGQYPCRRTVSDNFDTDSDYVQLPPLAWYPPPRPPPKKPNSLKLWKCVSKSGNSCPKPTGKAKQATPPSLSPPVNISTLPRRKSSDHSFELNDGVMGLMASKVSSRSTNALNLMGHAKPEPPPKPRKSMADLTSITKEEMMTRKKDAAVDARFIATKPQILIQTAYATCAPVAIPSQAQVLVSGSKVLGVGNGNNRAVTTSNVTTPAPVLQHSQSMDNIYDTVSEEPFVPSITPPPYPVSKTSAPLIIRPNNYIDVHASSVKSKLSLSKPTVTSAIANHYIANPAMVAGGRNVGVGNRCGSVPNNLNNFLIGLQNLKPLSRTPIVHPGATSCLALSNNANATSSVHTGVTAGHVHTAQCPVNMNMAQMTVPVPLQIPSSSTSCANPRFTTVYTNQLTRSQIQQFKAQLYSDLDYVIFPPKDPRVSQQEYFDSKYTTVSSTNSNPMLSSNAYSINEIPPPYLPPPPPYPSTPSNLSNIPPPLPKKNPKLIRPSHLNPNSSTNVTSSLSNHSIAATITSSPYHHNSFQSLYHPGSTNSYCSSQYGYYTATAASGGLNSDNLQRFLSTQSFTGSNGSSAPIYYASSTQSAPPLPPYKPSGHVIIENGMRKAVQQMVSSRNSAGLTASDERLRMNMKLCKSEESLYSQPMNETEEQLQQIYNLPPPPPYKKPANPPPSLIAKQEAFSAAELDLAHLRARCHALELPLLRALCSEGELLNKNTSTRAILQKAKDRIRPTAHAHPKLSLPPKNPPIPPKPNASTGNANATPQTTKAS